MTTVSRSMMLALASLTVARSLKAKTTVVDDHIPPAIPATNSRAVDKG